MSEAATASATRYVIDARGSRFTIFGYAAGLLGAMAHDPVIAAREVEGELRFAADNASAAALAIKISTRSLAIENDVSDKDRREIERAMNDEVLEVAKYPEVSYQAAGAKLTPVADGRFRVELDGQLTLHGMTRTQPVASQLFLMGDTLRGQGDFTLRQTDFGIKLFSAAGGTLKIKDELKCRFDLLARKAP